MTKTMTRYKVLLSSPSDALKYCEIAKGVIDIVNRQVGDKKGVELYPIDWEKDSYSQNGPYPQQVLDQQLVEQSDIILAIFYQRFGTPTLKYRSGTQEEIQTGIRLGKKVLLYFWKPSVNKHIKIQDKAQFQSVQQYKKSTNILYKEFSSENDFQKLLNSELTKFVQDLPNTIQIPHMKLTLNSLDAKMHLQKTASLRPIGFRYQFNFEKKGKELLSNLCAKIEGYRNLIVELEH